MAARLLLLRRGVCSAVSCEVAQAVAEAARALGRPPPPGAADALKSSWFETRASLAGLDAGTAAALGVPLRLAAALRDAALRDQALERRSEGAQAAEARRDDEHTSAGPLASAAVGPPRRGSYGSAKHARVSSRRRLGRYALRDEECGTRLAAELAGFKRWLTTNALHQQEERVAPVTADKAVAVVRGVLGWLHRERGVPLEELELSAVVPSAGRDGVAAAFDHTQWLVSERRVAPGTELMVLRGIMHCAKFLYHGVSESQPAEGDKPYHDVLVVRELRKLQNDARRRVRTAPRVVDEQRKWLNWSEFLGVVEQLRLECSPLDRLGRPRTPSAVAWSQQRYLIFAILSCVPDRQRTLRELEVGRTLVLSGEGESRRWVIRHSATDYKTGRAYGDRPPLVIAPKFYEALERFIEEGRSELGPPRHQFLFSAKSGEPLSTVGLYGLFTSAAFRLTGRRTNPHLVRDMIITHLRRGDVSEKELEALAIYMGHSIQMQRDTYDRRTIAEKVQPVVQLLESVNDTMSARLPGERAASA